MASTILRAIPIAYNNSAILAEMDYFKGAVMQTEKALINDQLHVSKVP